MNEGVHVTGKDVPMHGMQRKALPWPWFAALTAVLLLPVAAAGQVVEYYHLDALGSVRVVTNQSGTVVERHDYLPFGEECTTGLCATNPGLVAGQPRKFTSQERDTETGLDYFRARYYRANLGRFSSVDPARSWNPREPQSWNRYAYTTNNPLTFVDPDGQWKKKPLAWIVEYVGKRHIKVKPLFSNKEAARALRQNKNVDFARRQHGVAAQRPNSRGARPERDPPHPDRDRDGSTEGRYSHAHAAGRPEGVGHAAWGTELVVGVAAFLLSAADLDADPVNEEDEATLIEQFDTVSIWVYGKPATELTVEERQVVNDTMTGREPLPSTPHRNP